VKLVRHTEQKLLRLGEPITALGRQAQQLLAQTTTLSDTQRQRVAEAFTAALSNHAHIRTQSTRLTRPLRHCKLVNAYLTIAPILKAKFYCSLGASRDARARHGFLLPTASPGIEYQLCLPPGESSSDAASATSNACGSIRWRGPWHQ
jgi:hypothetical protein